jgi:hypothetical protein
MILLFSTCKKKEEPAPIEEPVATPSNDCPTCDFPATSFTNNETGAKLIFRFKFDSTQARLNNLGQPSTIPSGNAAYSPRFNEMSAHYIELAPGDLTQVGKGAVLYKADETTCGGSNAIVFCKSVVCKDGDILFSIPFSKVPAGSYKWLRISLAYQNYDIKVKTNAAGVIDGTIASFVGFNTYVQKYKMKDAVMTPTLSGANRKQGYWGFYTKVLGAEYKSEGEAPGTTVVNPNPGSPIPAGSCLVTGEFFDVTGNKKEPFVISGSETADRTITVSLSINKSFEWTEKTADGYFQPEIGEAVVDMGLRGLIPKFN